MGSVLLVYILYIMLVTNFFIYYLCFGIICLPLIICFVFICPITGIGVRFYLLTYHIYWVILVKSHCTIVFKFCFVACYISLIRGYFYYYLYMFDRIIMLNTHSFISGSSLLIYSVNYLYSPLLMLLLKMHVEDMYPYICLLYTSRCV